MWNKLKDGLWVLAGLGILLVIYLLVALFIEGAVRVIVVVSPWLATASSIALGVSLIILLPLSFIRASRDFAAIGLLIASYVIGIALWVWGLILAYWLWGFWAVLIGLFLFGVGVVPVAMLATLFNGMWSQLLQLVIATILTFGIRAYSIHVANKADN